MNAVCATDLSAASEATIESEACLECLSRMGVEEIHLVTVVPSNVHAGMPGINLESRRRKSLEQYRRTIEQSGFAVETHVVRGTPHRRITGLADATAANLTVVGSRGNSPLENRVVGSTTRNLARTTVTPLLVNRLERATPEPDVVASRLFERILYATDFSENAERAFEMFTNVRTGTQEATLVHVETPTDPELPDDEDPESRLAERASQLETWGIDTRIDLRQGDPVEEILAAERDHDPTTTLIGSRGHSRLRRLLLGSVSEELVARATGNVLLVPPERTA